MPPQTLVPELLMARIRSDATDAELINSLRTGQQEALSLLYDRYGGLVYSLALKMLGQTTEAEDLTQEIFLTFWKQERFDPNRAALSTYLCVMTRSRAINKLRSRASQQRTMDRLQQVTPAEFTSQTPLERATLLEQRQVVQAALAQLNPNQQRILELSYYQGLSQSEIAQQLGMPLGTVKTNARQGLIKLRKILDSQIT
jgi:RNA polymerase sigma-70 factor, ECF subfamily